MTPHIPDLSGTIVGGRYELLSMLGSGGFGAVYEARDQRLDRRVAVKLIHSWWALDPAWSSRFEEEARLTASLGHPGIVTVHDTGQDDGTGLWIVLELVDGESLAERMARERLDPDTAAMICADVLDALQAAHARGIVHRDIGPQNVLLGADGSVKITDFGVAYLSTGMTRSSAQATVVGKPIYMSPEQSRGKHVGPASDVYAVGVVLYELLAGHPPYDGENYVEIAMKHNSDEVPSLPDDTPPRLRSIVMRALSKAPGDRFASAADMASALRTTSPDDVSTEPVQPRTAIPLSDGVTPAPAAATMPMTHHRPSRRRRALVGVAVLVLVGAGAAIAIVLNNHTNRTSARRVANRHPTRPVPQHAKRKPAVQKVKTPKLVGLSKTAALKVSAAQHLTMTTTDATSDHIPVGYVLGQSPRAGSRTALGSDITATISTGPPPAIVPALTNLSLSSAEDALARKSLKPKIVMVAGGGASAGTVINQQPGADASVELGSIVTLDVARSPAWRTVTTMTLSSDGSSPLFRITAPKWRIRYTLQIGPCGSTGGQCFGPNMDVTASDSTFQSYQLSAGSHETYVPKPRGTYSFSLCCAQDPFTAQITVEQYS